MCKLGLATHEHIKTTDFDWYLEVFKEGLSTEQVALIQELFMHHPPPSAEEEMVDGAM
jgi:hypothetical protein